MALIFGPAPEQPEGLPPIPPDAFPVKVHEVIDGDTVDVVTKDGFAQRVRLLNVDTPELGGRGSEAECGSDRATQRLRELLPKQSTAFLSFDVEIHDVYERWLAHVWSESGIWTNGLLLREGYGMAVSIPPNASRFDEAQRLEGVALRNTLGLWSLCS